MSFACCLLKSSVVISVENLQLVTYARWVIYKALWNFVSQQLHSVFNFKRVVLKHVSINQVIFATCQ